MPYKMLFSALLLMLSGCAVYGDGYDRGYHHGHGYRYYDGHRRDYYPPPRYYYEERRHNYYPAPPRYVPAPPPRHQYGHDRRYRDGYKHQQPRHDYRRDQRRQEHRSGQIQRGWEAGRNTQHRFSNGRSNNEQRRSGERRW